MKGKGGKNPTSSFGNVAVATNDLIYIPSKHSCEKGIVIN